MLAVAAVSAAGYFLAKPSKIQAVQNDEARIEADRLSLVPIATRSPTDTDVNGITAQPDPFTDDFPDVPLRGGYGHLPPPYLNSNWEIGDMPAGGLTRPKREIYNEPPKPGVFLGMNDVVIQDEVRKRVMMEASSIQTDMNNFNGANAWAQGMTLVSKPNPQQAHIDSRKYPITSLSKPFSNHYIGPDTRRPNPTSTLGIAYNVTDRTGLFDEVVRLPERAIPFENQWGQPTAGATGNANLRPPVYDLNPYEYTRIPKVNCFSDQLERMPQGSYTVMLGNQIDTFREFEGQEVRKGDSVDNRIPTKTLPNGNVIYAQIDPLKQPLLKGVEGRAPGGSFNDQMDILGQSQEGTHVSKLPLTKQVERRQGTADVRDSYTSQALLPFEQQQKAPYEFVIDQQVGDTSSLQLHAGALLANPYAIPAGYAGRI